MTVWLLSFLILLPDGRWQEVTPTVEFPDRETCMNEGMATHQTLRAAHRWAFIDCTSNEATP